MELTTGPIVCQLEKDIPTEVKELRAYVRGYMHLQKAWQLIIVLIGCMTFLVYTPTVLFYVSAAWPFLGRLLDVLPAVFMALVVLPFAVYLVFGRIFGPNWVEQYYKARLVLIEVEPSGKPLGRFTRTEIYRVLKELSNRMGFLIDPGLFVFDKHKAEANAFYTSIVDHHTKMEKIVLHRNLLFILDAGELRAVIAHELGHMIQPWPLVFRSARYSKSCELLADYNNALVYAGLLPTVNALIKIYARKDYLSALWEKAQELLLESGFQLESIDELAVKADAHIRHGELGEREGEDEAERLVRRIMKRSTPGPRTRWQRAKLKMNLLKVRQLRRWRKQRKTHLPTQFTRFYSDHHIDKGKFEVLVQRLSGDKKSDLFVPALPRTQRKASHPSLRERLLFLARCAEVREFG
ncbi:MAG: M48 family metalloprotease [Candidatus Omnitrophica bacterium]|nr:M48 family metalloprotease [Candidatus Omnitrophota bacterium]